MAKGQQKMDNLSEKLIEELKYCGEKADKEQFQRIQELLDKAYGYKEIPFSVEEEKSS
jgi:hypothetical protein